MAFFENLRIENPDKFVDAEVEANSGLSDRVDNTERKLYEAACREGTPVVSAVCTQSTYSLGWYPAII